MTKKFKVLWTGPALKDLRSIKDYIAADGKPLAAKRLAKKFRERIMSLETLPQAGRHVPEFPGDDYREVFVAPYRIIYEISEDHVVILRLWHGRRDLTSLNR